MMNEELTKSESVSTDTLPSFHTGDVVYSLNPKYKDGTRLRRTDVQDNRDFNGIWLPNDEPVTVLSWNDETGFVNIRKTDGDEGWIRSANLCPLQRKFGVTKDVVSNELITPDAEYVRGIKIYNCGIKPDPAGSGSKFGKGLQHLISSHWLNAMSEFVATNYKSIRGFVTHAYVSTYLQGAENKEKQGVEGLNVSPSTTTAKGSQEQPDLSSLSLQVFDTPVHEGYDVIYFTNMANHLLNRAEATGLRTRDSMDLFLMATFLVMCAAEVDDFPFTKYNKAERKQHHLAFYQLMLNPRPGPGVVESAHHDDANIIARFAAPPCRRDLLPPIAMERLGINNELSGLKYKDPEQPLREGFIISARIDSLKRHFEGVHRRMFDEDHVIHLLWNFHAIYHVLAVFPDKNDLVDYRYIASFHGGGLLDQQMSSSSTTGIEGAKKKSSVRYEPTTSLAKIEAKHEPMSQVQKLDWNEGAIPPPKSVTAALLAFMQADNGSLLKWYPHLSGGEALREGIVTYCGSPVIRENVLITNGSDEALVLLCQHLLHRDLNEKTVLAPTPTYEHFCVNATVSGAGLIRLNMPDPFVADLEYLQCAIEQEHPHVVYLVSPNNPTGVEWTSDQVSDLLFRFPQTVFIVDEAYYEFGTPRSRSTSTGEKDGSTKWSSPINTCAYLATQHTNVIVTRTFSKAFCLASVRCGYIIAHPNVIEDLKRFYNPKSVNQFAQVSCVAALQEFDSYYKPYIELTNKARGLFVSKLCAAGVHCQSAGAGNFACIYLPPSTSPQEQKRAGDVLAPPNSLSSSAAHIAKFCSLLEDSNIYVRDISARFPGYVRVSIGVEMTRVIEAIIDVHGTIYKKEYN